MRSYRITEFGGAVSEATLDIPEPHGTEVLIKVTHAGVCHSDLHIAGGYYNLGAGAKLTLGDRDINLPHTMGHEVLGTAIKAGPDAAAAPIGVSRLVRPWIGCMECSECQRGRANLYVKAQSVSVFRPGGYAEYMLVPHPKFLVNADGIHPAVATAYACSGVTVYSALKKALPVGDDEWLVIMGCGGLGGDGEPEGSRRPSAAAQRHRRRTVGRGLWSTRSALRPHPPSASPRWSKAAVMSSLVCSAESSGCRYRRYRCGQFRSSAPIPAI